MEHRASTPRLLYVDVSPTGKVIRTVMFSASAGPEDNFQQSARRSDSINEATNCFANAEVLTATMNPALGEALELYKTLCSQRTHSLAGDTKPTDGKQLLSNGA